MKKLLTGGVIAVCLQGCGDQPPIEIYTYKQGSDNGFVVAEEPYLSVKVTAKSKDVEIQNVIVNHGDCKRVASPKVWGVELSPPLPKKLGPDQSVGQAFNYSCSIKHIKVITDLGAWEWEY
ncbi:MAG: hypothetical protein KBT87_11135 [Gammaproteobacteria bacterium]|nr:hypothetical protein [Gammaproteobacteria bacterium]MBQ0775216.1 hypothetical protein [Gammaproteobacteria bacterium]